MRTLLAITAILLISVALFFGWQELSTDLTLTNQTGSGDSQKLQDFRVEESRDLTSNSMTNTLRSGAKSEGSSESEVGEEVREINARFSQEDVEQSGSVDERTELQRKVDGIVAKERRKFFGDLVRELRDKLDVNELGIVLLELREILEQNLDTRKKIRNMLDEIMILHENPKDDFFEKVSAYRRERIEFFKTLSLQLQASLQERNLPQEDISLVINSLEKRLEKQRIIF